MGNAPVFETVPDVGSTPTSPAIPKWIGNGPPLEGFLRHLTWPLCQWFLVWGVEFLRWHVKRRVVLQFMVVPTPAELLDAYTKAALIFHSAAKEANGEKEIRH